MAFTTTFRSRKDGSLSNAYNIDFPVGAGARGNVPEDVMLVQLLFRILYFEVALSGGDAFVPPAGHTTIEVDGKFGPATARFVVHWQKFCRDQGMNVLLDGVIDPMRGMEESSTRSRTRYAIEILNHTCFAQCRKLGIANYDDLANRTDIPLALASAVKSHRTLARAYAGRAFA